MKMGRPIKLPDEALTEYVKVRMSKSEKELLLKKAINTNHSISSFLRQAALKGKIKPIDKVRPQLLAELGRVGNNINQIAHKANANGQGLRLNAREFRIMEDMHRLLGEILVELIR